MRGDCGKLWNPAHRFYKRGRVLRLLARFLEKLNMIICSNAISAKAEIGERTVFKHHGVGCVVHDDAVIGDNCTIMQNVTIGVKGTDGMFDGGLPHIWNNVMIGAGAAFFSGI